MSKYFILIITFLGASYLILQDGSKSESLLLDIIHLVIIMYACTALFSYEENSFSLHKSFALFTLFFVGIAPVIQFKNGIGFWGLSPLSESECLFSSSVYLLAIIVFELTYRFEYNSIRHQFLMQGYNFWKNNRPLKLGLIRKLFVIFICVVSFLLIFWLNNFNMVSLLIRGGELKESVETSKMSGLIISKFIQPINIILFLFVKSFSKYHYLKIFLFFMAIISAPPTGLARFAAASLYIPILLSFKFARKRNVYVLFFIVGLLVLFPAMSILRDYKGEFAINGFASDMFESVDFDSYFIYGIILKNDIVTYGKQLLGVCLFWLPRDLWSEKPVGSGQMVGEDYGFTFTNLSCNFFGEGYVNWGFLGIILFAIVLGIVYATIDKMYWYHCQNKTTMYYSTIIYTMIVAESFLMLRGDLLSSTAYLCGYIASYLFVRKIVFGL